MLRPSSPGSIRSRITRSGCSARMRAAAQAPSASMATRKPLPSRYSRVNCARRWSSSTIRICHASCSTPYPLSHAGQCRNHSGHSRGCQHLGASGKPGSFAARQALAQHMPRSLHIVLVCAAPGSFANACKSFRQGRRTVIGSQSQRTRALGPAHPQGTHILSTGCSFPGALQCLKQRTILYPHRATPTRCWVTTKNWTLQERIAQALFTGFSRYFVQTFCTTRA